MRFMVWMEKKWYIFLFLIVLLGSFLRLYKVTTVPPGLYIDEISIGYNANEILTKGVDQFGVHYPLWFRAFGEYKMPVYIYSVAASIAAFGRTDFAVRAPSIFSGILTLIVFYFLVKKLLEFDKKLFPFNSIAFSLLATFFLAISTWHLQFSRAGFEATMALFFYLVSLLCFIYFCDKKNIWLLILGNLTLALSAYTYDGYRFIAPVTAIIIAGVYIYYKQFKMGLLGVLFFFLLFIPLIQFSLTGEGATRLSQTSAFANMPFPFMQKVIQYPLIYLKNYLSYFSSNFLFNMGDGIGRHEIPGFGVLEYWQVPFLLLGFFQLLKYNKTVFARCIVFLLILTPIAPALTLPSPHALRSLLFVVPFTAITTLGFGWVVGKLWVGKKKIILFVIILAMLYEYGFYLHYYYNRYPVVTSIDWGGGYKEMVTKAVGYSHRYQHVLVEQSISLDVKEIPLFFGYYTNNSFNPQIVTNSWKAPTNWKQGTTILIRTFYGQRTNKYIIDNVYLPGANKDVFAQFWKI